MNAANQNDGMTVTTADIAKRIVQAHEAANAAMRGAVEHAFRAGELLTEAKEKLPHGSFSVFCASLPFAPTTARGYMRLARLDLADRQRVAVLPLRTALLEIAKGQPAKPVLSAQAALLLEPGMDSPYLHTPSWTPTPGHWNYCFTENGDYHVVPSLEHPGRWHVSRLDDLAPDDSRCDVTHMPVRSDEVEMYLQSFGLDRPLDSSWSKTAAAGMSTPWGMPTTTAASVE